MDSQDLFAKRIAARLDEGLGQLDPRVAFELDRARAHAMGRRRDLASRVGPGVLAWTPFFGRRAHAALGAMLLMAAATWGQYARIQWAADEAADLDEEILSQPAPMQSYTDPAFLAALRSGALGSPKLQSP